MELNDVTLDRLTGCVARSQTRGELWAEFIREIQVQAMAEIGVFEGNFAAFVLKHCPSVETYYMIDPWRHLDSWNKPANKDDVEFERILETAKAQTNFAEHRRVILRGKTTEVIDSIPDEKLDFAYIDGDHTLKGIAVDMVRVFPKVSGVVTWGETILPGLFGSTKPALSRRSSFPLQFISPRQSGRPSMRYPTASFACTKPLSHNLGLLTPPADTASSG